MIIVPTGSVKDQVARSRVRVRKMMSARIVVATRVFELAFVKLDLLMGHANVVSHALTRTWRRLRKHYLVVLACILFTYRMFFELFTCACCNNFPIEFNKLEPRLLHIVET
jgi:hypothetical protein